MLHGESIGSAVTADLASRRACLAVVLECPFTSVSDMAARSVPVQVIHGDADRRIPYPIGRAVFKAANEPKYFWTVEGARHLNIVEVAGDR